MCSRCLRTNREVAEIGLHECSDNEQEEAAQIETHAQRVAAEVCERDGIQKAEG